MVARLRVVGICSRLSVPRGTRAFVALMCAFAGSFCAVAESATAATTPAPCGGIAQISDAALDGHHNNTDILSAWFAEQNGAVQAVMRPRQAVWEPIHDDSEAAGFALLFEQGGITHYVRAEAPRAAAVRFDYGTWSIASGFVSMGPTSGFTSTGGSGAVVIDIPAAAGAAPGAVLARPFVLTYDGTEDAGPHWVDRAPGGVTPIGTEFGADFTVGSCSSNLPGGSSDPSGGGNGDSVPISSLSLQAPTKIIGDKTVNVSGRTVPSKAGLAVDLFVKAKAETKRSIQTAADGSFSTALKINETTSLRASAAGIGSQTVTVTVDSTVRISVRRRRGRSLINGAVRPALPGRILLLRVGGVTPVARTTARHGRFQIKPNSKKSRGRFEAVFIPFGNRAERSTSNKGTIR